MKKYPDGQEICIGDVISYGEKTGRIVFLIEEGRFISGYKEGDWAYLKQGIGIEMEDGELFVLDEPDEDLAIQKRSLGSA